MLPAGVRLERREQVRVPAGPAVRDPLLLAADRGLEFLVDGDGGLARILWLK